MSESLNESVSRARRESMRWYILRTLDVGRPSDVSGHLLTSVLRGEYQDVSEQEVKREVDYLDERGLVKLVEEPSGRWHATLTRDGIDVVEYTVVCDPGIARPKK
jgi:hypothetical protein